MVEIMFKAQIPTVGGVVGRVNATTGRDTAWNATEA